MSDLQYYINILNSGFVQKTDIPTIFLVTQPIQEIIKTGKWNVFPSRILGWTTFQKLIAHFD